MPGAAPASASGQLNSPGELDGGASLTAGQDPDRRRASRGASVTLRPLMSAQVHAEDPVPGEGPHEEIIADAQADSATAHRRSLAIEEGSRLHRVGPDLDDREDHGTML